MNRWEAVFIDRTEGKKIVLSQKEHGYMYTGGSSGRSKILYSQNSKLFDLVPFSVPYSLKPIILAIYHNQNELKDSKGMVLKKFKKSQGIVPKAFSAKMRQHIRGNMKKKNTTEWVYFINNEEEIFKINEDRTIGDKLSKEDIDIIKKSVEDLLKDKR